MNKIHFIFSHIFFDSHILLKQGGKTQISNLMVPFQNDPEIMYRDKYFIQNFGQLKISFETSRGLISGFGAKGNFYFFIKSSNCYIKIIPLIHMYNLGIVNIIFSGVYITNNKTIGQKDLDTILDLRKSFEYGQTIQNLSCNKPSIVAKSLKEAANIIKININKSFPEFNFTQATSKTYNLYNIIKNYEKIPLTNFEQICSYLLSLADMHRLPQKKYFECSNIYEEDYLFVHPAMCLIFNSWYNQNFMQSKRRSKSWRVYRVIEYSIIEQFLWEYLVDYNIDIQNTLYKENTHTFSVSKLKLKNYDKNLIDLFQFLKLSFRNFNSFERKIVYMYYGGKENRNSFINNSKDEINRGLDLMSGKSTMVLDALKKIISLK